VDGIIKNDSTDLNRKVASPLITGGRYSCCHSEVMGATASPWSLCLWLSVGTN